MEHLSSERSADMFAQLASMILRGVRELDEAAREASSGEHRPRTADDGSPASASMGSSAPEQNDR